MHILDENSDQGKQELIDREWFYKRARYCPIIHRCVMEHEHNGLSWPAALALMAKILSESNEAKSNQITKSSNAQNNPALM